MKNWDQIPENMFHPWKIGTRFLKLFFTHEHLDQIPENIFHPWKLGPYSMKIGTILPPNFHDQFFAYFPWWANGTLGVGVRCRLLKKLLGAHCEKPTSHPHPRSPSRPGTWKSRCFGQNKNFRFLTHSRDLGAILPPNWSYRRCASFLFSRNHENWDQIPEIIFHPRKLGPDSWKYFSPIKIGTNILKIFVTHKKLDHNPENIFHP